MESVRTSPALLRFSRYGCFVIVAAAFGSKNMCFGGSQHPAPDPPVDAEPGDTSSNGSTSLRSVPGQPVLAARTAGARAPQD